MRWAEIKTSALRSSSWKHQLSCSSWLSVKDCSKESLQPFWKTYYRISCHAFFFFFSIPQRPNWPICNKKFIQALHDFTINYPEHIHQHIVLRPVYDWNPMQWIHNRCCLRVQVTSTAAEFWTLDGRVISVIRKPYRRALA